LTRSDRAGVDAFVKQGATLEAFWQGHPEYEADTLARELRRDFQRFLSGAARVPPPLPENYLTAEARAQLEAYVDDVAGGGVTTTNTLELPDLVAKTAHWAESSRRLMGAFLTAAWRRKQFRCAAEAAETSFAGR